VKIRKEHEANEKQRNVAGMGSKNTSSNHTRKERAEMDLSRRGFLKISGAALAAGGLGINLDPVKAHAQGLRIKQAKETITICPYCAVGCGIIVHTDAGKVINTEGDPDHPINEGALCSKGSSLYQITHNNPGRLTKPLYRASGSARWEAKPWDWVLDKIAENIKKSRDASFKVRNAKGQVVNRTDGIASVGSAALDNEECYAFQKFLRALGLVYIEHQARI
jgi:formate dehydrogenase major subunit